MKTTEQVLSENIRATIKRARAQGDTGMSLACLKQNTPTRGLTCHPAEYHAVFPAIARRVAARFLID